MFIPQIGTTVTVPEDAIKTLSPLPRVVYAKLGSTDHSVKKVSKVFLVSVCYQYVISMLSVDYLHNGKTSQQTRYQSAWYLHINVCVCICMYVCKYMHACKRCR